MNLDEPSHLADLLSDLAHDDNLRESLIRKGTLRLVKIEATQVWFSARLSVNNLGDTMTKVLKKFGACRICWR